MITHQNKMQLFDNRACLYIIVHDVYVGMMERQTSRQTDRQRKMRYTVQKRLLNEKKDSLHK